MKKLRKFISSLLIAAICGGLLMPSTVLAAENVEGVSYPVNAPFEQGGFGSDTPSGYANTFFADLQAEMANASSTNFQSSFDWQEFEKSYEDWGLGTNSIGEIKATDSNLAQRMSYSLIMDYSLHARYHGADASTKDALNSAITSEEDWKNLDSYFTSFLATYAGYGSDYGSMLGDALQASYATDIKDDAMDSIGSGTIKDRKCLKVYGTPANASLYPEISDMMKKTRAVLLGSIYDFAVLATTTRESYVAMPNLDKNARGALANAKLAYDTCHKYIPILDELWNLKDPNEADDKSLKELCENNDIEGAALSFSTDVDSEHILKEEDVIGYMYQLNGTSGIAGADMESIVDDVDVNTQALESLGALVDKVAETQGTFEKIVTGIQGLQSMITHKLNVISTTSKNDTVSDIAQDLSGGSNLNEDGLATDYLAVSLSDYITEGMAYSATYVPLKTNVYSPQVIKQYDDKFRNNFFYKYGFMRKAVYIDTSGSAVQDYYNSSGQSNSLRRVCTLRDLVECSENDVMLYVDDNFYNAQQAIEQGNELNQAHYEKVCEVYDALQQWIATGDSINAAPDLELNDVLTLISGLTPSISNLFVTMFQENLDNSNTLFQDYMLDRYNFDVSEYFNTISAMKDLSVMGKALDATADATLSDKVLKTGDYGSYDSSVAASLTKINDVDKTNYRYVSSQDLLSEDNYDSIVLSSSYITDYFFAMTEYSKWNDNGDGTYTVNNYTSRDPYSPCLSLAWVSAIYRDLDTFTIANTIAHYTPVFMASDEVCEVNEASQWYRNTILNWALLKNLKSAAPLDYTYASDLDCPVYIDIFGNIISEGGLVVIPAASNATLHCASFHENNVAVGLYAVYGNDYYIPLDKVGAYTALDPFFYPDVENDVYIVNGTAVQIGEKSVRYDTISPYDADVQDGVMKAYLAYVKDTIYTRVNWPVMVNIINEVMRGAPIENIDKEQESLYTAVDRNKAAIVAAAKLEALNDSIKGTTENTLLSIPDFSRMDDFEYVVAFCIKMLIVATAAVVIIAVYRDGVSGQLGLRTLWKSLSSIALTFAAVCVIPAVFQLTYYAANKYMLHDECMRILILNTEKKESGIEIGMLDTYTPDTTNDMALQLDWIRVPWYEQLDNMLYGSTLKNLDDVKNQAYRQTPTYDNPDVTIHNDGVYITTDDLFESARIDYAFENVSSTGVPGLYVYSNNTVQTASYYSPYYMMLYALLGNINEYNYYHDSYNYSTKMMSGNVMKTVGLCNDYFTSKSFMEIDTDILHLNEVYELPINDTIDRAVLFDEVHIEQFKNSLWYNNIDGDGLEKRIDLMNKVARDFVAENKDMLTKVSDETFIKVMALHCAIKYNQYFGITSANAIEIYNMDSTDLLRLSIVKSDEAVLAAPYSFARYVYTFGGEPSVYAAAILSMIMWIGSFIKPLCTVIVFISVFLSIWVFRVVLRKPSSNLLGYLITVGLLCATNLLHAVLLKVSISLPNWGLSTLGCLLFLIVGQVAYLLLLGYVTGVSLKDWQNLGVTEYEREARLVKSKFKGGESDYLSGTIKHHENNWDYYNDLVEQHRSRNA